MNDKRPLKIAIAADQIETGACGLGHFLLKGVSYLSKAEPSWQFTIVAQSGFGTLSEIASPNVKIIFWDKRLLFRWTVKFLSLFFGQKIARYGVQVLFKGLGKAPLWRLRAMFGDPKAIWRTLSNADGMWMPYYSLRTDVSTISQGCEDVSAPLLMTVHDLHLAYYPNEFGKDEINMFWKGFKNLCRRCRLITLSQYQKDGIVEHFGAEPERIGVVHTPPLLDEEQLLREFHEDEKSATLHRFGISKPFAFYSGSTTITHKNHIRLILAWSKLKEQMGSACPQLVCTANRHYWPAIAMLIESLHLQETVIFTGSIDDKCLAILYQECRFVVFPSLYEGSGAGPVAEACVAGRPLLCARIPPIVEYLEAYGIDDVIYFDPHSVDEIVGAVDRFFGNEEMFEACAKSNQEKIRSNMNKMWESWAAFYVAQMRETFIKER